ncbi:MAG: SRPBCC family protein [Burkholderiales bacterium]|nr:SRPBCC family protein [Burkholderiales bacterium]
MTSTVNVELGYAFEVKTPAKEVFAVLANVPDSASYYPKVDRLVDLGDGAYRWEMEKIGFGSVHLQTVYASRYVSNQAKGTVVWTPVKGEGNALVSGSWKITDKKKSTKLVLKVQGELTLPVPALMAAVIAPLVEAEFENLTEHYIDNLVQRFGGEA